MHGYRIAGQKRVCKGKEPNTPAIVPPSPDSSDTEMDCLTPMIDIGNPDEEFKEASISGPDPDAPLFLPWSSDGQSRPADRVHDKYRSYRATAKDDGQLHSSASKPPNKDVGHHNRSPIMSRGETTPVVTDTNRTSRTNAEVITLPQSRWKMKNLYPPDARMTVMYQGSSRCGTR